MKTDKAGGASSLYDLRRSKCRRTVRRYDGDRRRRRRDATINPTLPPDREAHAIGAPPQSGAARLFALPPLWEGTGVGLAPTLISPQGEYSWPAAGDRPKADIAGRPTGREGVGGVSLPPPPSRLFGRPPTPCSEPSSSPSAVTAAAAAMVRPRTCTRCCRSAAGCCASGRAAARAAAGPLAPPT